MSDAEKTIPQLLAFRKDGMKRLLPEREQVLRHAELGRRLADKGRSWDPRCRFGRWIDIPVAQVLIKAGDHIWRMFDQGLKFLGLHPPMLDVQGFEFSHSLAQGCQFGQELGDGFLGVGHRVPPSFPR